MTLILWIVLYGSATTVYSALPYGWKPCSKSSPKYNECMVEAFNNAIVSIQNGSKLLGTPPLHVIRYAPIEMNEGNAFNISFFDSSVTGIDKLRATKVRNNGWKTLTVWTEIPGEVWLKGSYKVKGAIITLKINSEGTCDIKSYDVKYKFIFHFSTEVKNGKKYHFLKKVDNRSDIKKVVLKFTPKGKEAPYTNALNQLLNENWKVFYDEQRNLAEKNFIDGLFPIAAKIFSEIPAEEYDIP